MQGSGSIRDMLKPRTQWRKDKEASHCFDCGKEFLPIVRWRHHCRFCGNIFCSKCSDNILQGEQIDYKDEKRLRHCDQCHEKVKRAINGKLMDYTHKSEIFDLNDEEIKIDLEENLENNLQQMTNSEEQGTSRQKIAMKEINSSFKHQVSRITLDLCERHGLDVATWRSRLQELALQTVTEVMIETFVRSDYFNLLKEVRVVTTLPPTDTVTSTCIKGLILERNIPSKQLPNQIQFPNILIFKPAIEAENLMTGQTRFDMMIKIQNTVIRSYLQKIYKLRPNVIFVAGHVSKVAFEDFVENGIMVISKMKMEDLYAIQRLALIRKIVDHLHFIDIYRPVDLIGVCQKIYFKNSRQGQMVMIIEQEGGMRSVMLGDPSQEVNVKLKEAFGMLLRLAWRLKKARDIAIKDIKFMANTASGLALFGDNNWKQYNIQKLQVLLEVKGTKIIYKHGKTQYLQKPFEQYCLRLGHSTYMQQCYLSMTFPTPFRARCYDGEDLLLGTYLLKCIAGINRPCKFCITIHAQRYYIGNHYITIKLEPYNERLSKFMLKNQLMEQELANEDQSKIEPVQIYESIMRHFQSYKEKMVFFLLFKCEFCSEIITNFKQKLGKEYLSISLLHFLSQMITAYKCKGPIQISGQKRQKCEHPIVSRLIQSPRGLIKFTVNESVRHSIKPIYIGEKQKTMMLDQDDKYLMDIYNQQITEKFLVLQEMESQMLKMPFSTSISASMVSSISGIPMHEHPLFGAFLRIRALIEAINKKMGEIQEVYQGYFTHPQHDWTIVMRKFYKIEHVLKVLYDIIIFIGNSLKKEKVDQTSSLTSLQDQLQFTEIKKDKEGVFIRQGTQKDTQSETKSYSPSKNNSPKIRTKFGSARSLAQLTTSTQKQIGGPDLEQLDDILKKSIKQRFPLYQGIHLYYPIGNIADPVSLLACCLNSAEFGQVLRQQPHRDFITCKINFTKYLQTEWAPCKESYRIYSETLREDYPKNETFQYSFSIYFHTEFEELRLSEGVNFPLFIRSLYGCQSWDSSGGKSNSSFSKSHNSALVVKIINDKEFIQFQKFALAYLKYMKAKRDTRNESYLTKIYGIYEANIRNKVYKFVVMQNIFIGMSGNLKVYDLKGSQLNRLATPHGDKPYTGLDTNFIFDKDSNPYILDEGIYQKTIRTFEEDAAFLRDQSVIDYSLLVIQSQNILRMSIIDFMRPYHLSQRLESVYKKIKSGKSPTVIEPTKYAERFMAALKRYFIKVPMND